MDAYARCRCVQTVRARNIHTLDCPLAITGEVLTRNTVHAHFIPPLCLKRPRYVHLMETLHPQSVGAPRPPLARSIATRPLTRLGVFASRSSVGRLCASRCTSVHVSSRLPEFRPLSTRCTAPSPAAAHTAAFLSTCRAFLWDAVYATVAALLLLGLALAHVLELLCAHTSQTSTQARGGGAVWLASARPLAATMGGARGALG